MRGSITKRGKQSWQLKFDAPAVGGKRQQRYATVKGTYKDAQRELTRLLAASNAGTLPDPSNATVAEYLRTWLDTATAQAPKTIERYGELAERQIIPHLGAIKLQRLKPEDVRHWHSTLLGSGLAARTCGHAHRLLRLVLGAAVKHGTLTRNVAAVVAPPRVEETEIEGALSPDQIAAVLAALEGHTLYPIVALALSTGMRRGELLALQWGDIDLDGATLRIERSLEETNAGLRFKSPKTKRGRRNISLPAGAVALLRAHKVQLLELRFALGLGAIKPETLVFSTIEGGLVRPRNLTKAWSRVQADKKLPRVSFHALRHTHVSLLIAAGVDILTISRRLGHSKAAITLDVYGHLIGGTDEAAADAIAGVLK
jgi:integrase